MPVLCCGMLRMSFIRNRYLDSEAGGYNQNSWKSTYNFNAAPQGSSDFVSSTGGSWFVPPTASASER